MIQGLLENTEIDFERLARENAALHPTSSPNQSDDNEGFRTDWYGSKEERNENLK